MNEATTRLELIDPQIQSAKWGINETLGSQVIAEYAFTDGRLIGAGQRGKKKKADYVLAYQNQKLAIVEAKSEDKEITDGLEQVKAYAETLNIRFVYSTNGHGIYFFDMKNGRGEEVSSYHTPEELFSMTLGDRTDIQKEVLTEPFQRSKYSPRYYQENAVNHAVEAISAGEQRVLLTLATGTGKTTIAFQTVWKLYQARWSSELSKRYCLHNRFLQKCQRRKKIILLIFRRINLASRLSSCFKFYVGRSPYKRFNPSIFSNRFNYSGIRLKPCAQNALKNNNSTTLFL